MDYQFILFNLCDLVLSNDNGADDDVFAQWFLELGGPSIPAATLLKDRGNTLFKDGNFSLASLHYKSALKFLCFLGLPPLSDQTMASSLAFSTILNLAFSEFKLSNYTKTLLYCTFVLTFDPCNTKALYRRGLASKHLKSLPEALKDFEAASKIDPSNKDVNRELHSLVDQLAINLNGKRVALHFDPLAINKKGKNHVSSPEVQNVHENVIPPAEGESSCILSTSDLGAAHVELVTSSEEMDCLTDNFSSPLVENAGSNPTQAESSQNETATATETVSSASSNSTQLIFTNKKTQHNKLNLSSQDYESLMQGKNLEFFHPRSMSTMRVRPLISKTIQTGTPLEDFSGTAEVPFSSPMSESFTSSFEDKQAESERVALVQDDVFFQTAKKTRVSNDFSLVSKVSLTVFKFAAEAKELHIKGRRNEGRPQRKSRQEPGRKSPSFTTSRKRSLVSINVSTSLGRLPHGTTIVPTSEHQTKGDSLH